MVLEPREKADIPLEQPRNRMGELVNLVLSIGPNIAQISKKTGVPKETLRYWYKEKLLKKGFTVHATPDFQRLGLQRVVFLVEFNEGFREYAEPILMAMNELCYLHSFAKTLPENSYLVKGMVPREHIGSWAEFMEELSKMGFFTIREFSIYDHVRNVPMKGDIYDFDGERWEYEWSAPRVYPERLDEQEESTGDFDEVDLRIIMQLEQDANRSLSEMQENLKINYKTLTWHYREHVLRRGLLKGYKINWMGTRYDFELDKAMHRKHTYLCVELFGRDLEPSEKMELKGAINSTPFLWMEAEAERNYDAQLFFPLESIPDAMKFLGDAFVTLRRKVSWFIVDQSHAITYTIVPNLYDHASKNWSFDREKLLEKFQHLLLEIRGAGN